MQKVFYYITYELTIQSKWVNAMIYYLAASEARFTFDNDGDELRVRFFLNWQISLYTGVVIILISGAFVFCYDFITKTPTILTVLLFATGMMMLLLATCVMQLALYRLKKNIPKGCQDKRGLKLKRLVIYSLSYTLFLLSYIIFIVNATKFGLKNTDYIS